PAASTPSAAGHHALVRTYRAALTGAPHGARTGTGAAVIAFHGDSVACWRFAHLHNFLYATNAELRSGAPDRRGRLILALTRGPHLHHRGCVGIRPALVHAIERHPHNYTVNIDSARYPAGAIRGPL
ncbi:MAG: CHRD domain-containing protein, partial [Solirubrobacteraceae bacterium]